MADAPGPRRIQILLNTWRIQANASPMRVSAVSKPWPPEWGAKTLVHGVELVRVFLEKFIKKTKHEISNTSHDVK
jgi:hypothetical protein